MMRHFKIQISGRINPKLIMPELKALLLSDKENLAGCLNLDRERVDQYLKELILKKRPDMSLLVPGSPNDEPFCVVDEVDVELEAQSSVHPAA